MTSNELKFFSSYNASNLHVCHDSNTVKAM